MNGPQCKNRPSNPDHIGKPIFKIAILLEVIFEKRIQLNVKGGRIHEP